MDSKKQKAEEPNDENINRADDSSDKDEELTSKYFRDKEIPESASQSKSTEKDFSGKANKEKNEEGGHKKKCEKNSKAAEQRAEIGESNEETNEETNEEMVNKNVEIEIVEEKREENIAIKEAAAEIREVCVNENAHNEEASIEMGETSMEIVEMKEPDDDVDLSVDSQDTQLVALAKTSTSVETDQNDVQEVDCKNKNGENHNIKYTKEDFESSDSDCDTSSNMNSDEHQGTSKGSGKSKIGSKSEALQSHEARKRSAEDKSNKPLLRHRSSDRDTENYRNGYPGQKDHLELNDNLKFYMNKIRSTPDGDFIDTIHAKWKGKYNLLEQHHGYIQWLFPIREKGMNWQSQPLQLHEAEAIKADPQAKNRVLESYKLMLDFYGMELENEDKGTLKRSENWEQRYKNLNSSSHNYLRITRILKCLGELGYEPLKKEFIRFVLEEIINENELVNTLQSCQNYWIGTIKDKKERENLYNTIDRYEEENHPRVGSHILMWQICSQIATRWQDFCWGYFLQLASLPITTFWWLIDLIHGSRRLD